MLIALCQVNPTVGDVAGNARLVVEAVGRAADAGARLAVLPELVLSGYPAEDLWLQEEFTDACAAALDRIAPQLPITTVVGCPRRLADGRVRNAAAVVVEGAVDRWYVKQRLPNYAVFDEERWFEPGADACLVEVDGTTVGVTICEDAWLPAGPAVQAVQAGAQVVVNLSASPWRLARSVDREVIVRDRARETGAWFLLCNQYGGQDELVFDGQSLAAAPDGTIVARGAAFGGDLVLAEVGDGVPVVAAASPPVPSADEETWQGLVLGLGDYVRKNGFRDVILGLSGGIDSALVLALAVDALGAQHVHAVTMPSRYSSAGTRGDAHAQAVALGVEIHELPISDAFGAFATTLAPVFGDAAEDVTEENLQARIRGTLLMAISNKFGHLVLATGNKSEFAVGYATLYGDMNGGFAPIKDVLKTRVFRLARWRNEVAAAAGEAPRIPPSVIERPPSAELREGQQDSDSLPDYDELDAVLTHLVDPTAGTRAAIGAGHDPELVRRIQRMLDRAEYKRRQGPPGVRVTSTAFGRDRRMPITNKFDATRPGD
ncbi:MAG: synthetase [Thermoleophilia bacterium]|nr:synthetase [Thermoleophilia bacterium]